METKTEFRDLSIGDTFDFISPDRILNSFYETCKKVSARRYSYHNTQFNKDFIGEVGSIHAKVYHVNGAVR